MSYEITKFRGSKFWQFNGNSSMSTFTNFSSVINLRDILMKRACNRDKFGPKSFKFGNFSPHNISKILMGSKLVQLLTSMILTNTVYLKTM
jgi:hypothetical protein